MGLIVTGLLVPARAWGQEKPASGPRDLVAASQFTGRPVEAVKIVGNATTSTSVIMQLVRTHVGDKFDPATVVEDYQRIYDKMKTFANVEARVEPTVNGVIVIFVVTEQKQIHEILYRGNVHIKTPDLQPLVDLKSGQAIDRFRINLARTAIEKLYHDKNFPFAHVDVPQTDLSKTGDIVFNIVEGPQVTIHKVDFIGNNTFSSWRLKDQIKTAYYIFIFRAGSFDPETVDEDCDALRKYYTDKGFFDVRVGRKLTFSPDQKEMQVTFLIDEGPRYVISRVEFKGLNAVTETALRKDMKDVEGVPYDKDAIDSDIRNIVKVYSKAGGFVYDQQAGSQPNPDYLQIDTKPVFKQSPGKVDLVYEINEGNQFRLGRVIIKGNTQTKDKVILREMRVRPGQMYDSAQVEDAADRLRGTPYFQSVTITPVGDDPHVRDLMVDVNEAKTAQINAGVGVNSNGGFGGQVSYDQKNFDITNFPTSTSELFSNRAFTGAGQDFTASFEPGTEATNATISFTEPYLFDQPYSFGLEAYLEDRIREDYNDDRLGSRLTLGQRFNYVYSASVFFRVEDVDIKSVIDPELRAPEIQDGQGHHSLTSTGILLRRDTTNHGPVTFKGTDTDIGIEQVGALGGSVNFTRLTFSFNDYQEITEDLLSRKTVLNTRINLGYNPSDAPFYERFYGGGIGSIRGFEFRGVSPRAGVENDQIGGDFSLTGGPELEFPLAEDFLRGVVFIDAGDVEHAFRVDTIRTSIGFGFRLVLPFFGQVPLALDFGFPITQNRLDQTQIVSFSFGLNR